MAVARQRNSDLDAALADARERYAAVRPNSARIHQRAREVLPGGNTRSVLFYTPFPAAMVRGEGCLLEDVDNHRYVDFCGEYTAGLFGHSEPRIRAACQAPLGWTDARWGDEVARYRHLLAAHYRLPVQGAQP